VTASNQAGLSSQTSVRQHVISDDFRITEVRKLRKKGKALLAVEVAGRGVVELKGRHVKTRRKQAVEGVDARRVRRSGLADGLFLRLLLAPKGKKARTIRERGKTRVRYKLTYTPEGGPGRSKRKQLQLIRRR